MYDDPMREQMRQANRIARLQAMTGQHLMGAPLASQAAPVAEPAQQPFDFSRNITGAMGGTAGWMAGAQLAAKLAGAFPHPAAKIGGGIASFAIPTIASMLGASAVPAAIDAVSPSIHEGVNSAFRKVGPAGLLGGGALAAYLAYKNRKGLGNIGDDVANAMTPRAAAATIPKPMSDIMTDGIGIPKYVPVMQQAPPVYASAPASTPRVVPGNSFHYSPIQANNTGRQGYDPISRQVLVGTPAADVPHLMSQHIVNPIMTDGIGVPDPLPPMMRAPYSERVHHLPPVHSWGEVVPAGHHIVPGAEDIFLKPPSLRDSGAVVSHVGPRTPFSTRFSDNAIEYHMPKGQPTGAESYSKLMSNNSGEGSYKPIVKPILKKNKSKRPPK